MAKNEKVAIGIDMGTSFCTVGVLQNGQVEIVLNEGGKPVTANCVAFTDGGELVGDQAKAQEPCNPENTIYGVKRLIGKSYGELEVENSVRPWPFRVINVGGQPKVQVICNNEEKRFTPVEIWSMVLAKVKEMAEAFLGRPVEDAVIAVPTYFNEIQRRATKDAGSSAGFNVLRIINEPTAAALAYGFFEREGKRYALIYDLGGGTLNVSVFSIANGSFELKACSGNTQLGGQTFDAIVVAHFAKEIKEKHGIDITGNRLSLGKLQAACEQAKLCLSTANEAIIKVEGLTKGFNFRSSLSRSKFEELNGELFKSTLCAIEDVLSDANITKDCISEIVLVGGSTRIPKIQNLIREFFCGKQLTQTINPDEAVALGAAIQAAALSKPSYNEESVELDECPLSIGIKTAGGVMAVLIPRNSRLPCSCSSEFSTYTDNQPIVLIQVYEGERTLAEDNHHLGDFEISGLPPAPRGVPRIEVTFNLDRNGILMVTAEEKATGMKNAMIIANTGGRLSNLDIERILRNCQKFQQEDEEKKSTAQARNSLESYCLDLLGCSNRLKKSDNTLVTTQANDALKWLECNPGATRESILGRKSQVEKICASSLAVVFGNCSKPSSSEDDCKSDETKSDD